MTEDANLTHSVQRGLLGNVGPNLVGVAARFDHGIVTVEAFVTEHVTDEEREALDDVLTDVISDFAEPIFGQLHIQTVAGTHLVSSGIWAYVRLGYTVSRTDA